MARRAIEPLSVEQAKAHLLVVADRFAVPQALLALLAGVFVGCSPAVRRAFLVGGKWLLRRLI